MKQSLIIIGLFVIVAMFVSKFCYINTTASLPRGIYLKTSQPIGNDSFIVFHPTAAQQPLVSKYVKNTPLMKRVAALPGQTYQLPPASDTDSKGQAITPFSPKTGIVPSAQFIVIGDTKYSLDSRYLGFIPQSSIIDTITPLFVF